MIPAEANERRIIDAVPECVKERLLDEAWGFRPEPANTHFFLCGNPGMLDAIKAILEEEGFQEHTKKSPGQIHMEKYW